MSALLALVLSALVTWQEPPASRAGSARLERVIVIGGSMAVGFGAERSFAEALEAAIRAPHRPVLCFGDGTLFTSPRAIGARQVEAALNFEPTLVVATDFLFWFGYGTLDAGGGAIERESERLELLESGLALLGGIECPLVVGDFPDMSAAIGKMLAAEQVPAKTTLPLLSKRVREWAAGRRHTLVVPLSELVVQLASTTEIRMGRHTFPAGSKLLQPDQLHASLLGLVGVSQYVCDQLVRAELAAEADFDFVLEHVLERLGKARPAAGSAPR